MLHRKPNLIVVAGPNGSGKTVTTDVLRQQKESKKLNLPKFNGNLN